LAFLVKNSPQVLIGSSKDVEQYFTNHVRKLASDNEDAYIDYGFY
jgi:hypothetical protein